MTVIRRRRASDWKRGDERPEEPAQEPTPAARSTRRTRTTEAPEPAPAPAAKGDDGETMLDEEAILAELVGEDSGDPEIVRTARVIARFKAGATNRRSAIRAFCVECMGGAIQEVGRCQSTDCSLYPFRMGENPFDARTIAAMAKAAKATEPEPEQPARNRRSRK